MSAFASRWWIIAPLLVFGSYVCADTNKVAADGAGPFSFDQTELDAIRFSRSVEAYAPDSDFASSPSIDRPADFRNAMRQTEFSFKLKPKLPNFSREGAYGFDLFDSPRIDIRSNPVGRDYFRATPTLLNGFEYSAGLRLEHEDELIDGTAYVSSSLLGLSYGRLGRLWYGAIDVNLEQFAADRFGGDVAETLSLDLTTGRRFGVTGLDAHSPLWMLSVQGNLDMSESAASDSVDAGSDWFINPSLFWQQPGFMFSAQMQVPLQFETLDDEGEPDYRLRAIFEKQFK